MRTEFDWTTIRRHLLILLLWITPTLIHVSSLARDTLPAVTSPVQWGTFLKPFLADSLWNSRPVEPTFSSFEIPKSTYSPFVGTGDYSTGVFLAAESDPPVVIHPGEGRSGIWDPDAEELRSSVVIPHWPVGVAPATGTDGHGDVIDQVTGIVHSFYQLKYNKASGQWTATQYAWSSIKGTGWGDPAHYFQGARAAGVSATAGLIRKSEIDDGLPVYQHALAMSLTFNALSARPTYIYPATSADTGAETQNSGLIPEGALMMLPPDYDSAKIVSPQLRKIADTLKVYGAYIVDRNTGTPFVIYVENGSGFSLHPGGTWNSGVAADLDHIRAGLRQVLSAKDWIDGNGQKFTPNKTHRNVLSMRGPWVMVDGVQPGSFDTWSQSLSFPAPADGRPVIQKNVSSTGLGHVDWAKISPGTPMRFTVNATGSAQLQLVVFGDGKKVADSGGLSSGASFQFVWPADGTITLIAISGSSTPSSVSAELISLDN